MANEVEFVDENVFQRRGKWFFWSDNSSWEISSTISVDTNDSLADISELNGEHDEYKYSSAFHVRRHFLFSMRTWERGKTVCGRLGRQTYFRTKTSARLKITFVDMTYPGQRPEPPSVSPHFLLSEN